MTALPPIAYRVREGRRYRASLAALQLPDARIQKTLRLLTTVGPAYPGLRCKRLWSTGDVHEARINDQYRLIWRWQDGVLVLLGVVEHDAANRIDALARSG